MTRVAASHSLLPFRPVRAWKFGTGVLLPHFSPCARLKPYGPTQKGRNQDKQFIFGQEESVMSTWYWEDVSGVSGAQKAINGGFWAALLVAIVTSVFVGLSFAGVGLLGIGPAALLDAAIFAAIAVGIKRKSRVAAVSGLILYIIERIYMLQRGGTGGVVMGIIFTLLFINAVRGAFAYHRLTAGPARPFAPTA
jgi:hypothetical protein